MVQTEFGLLFVVITEVLIQLTGFVQSPLYPLIYLAASLFALMVRSIVGLFLLAFLVAIDFFARLIWTEQPIPVTEVLMKEGILLLFFGIFLFYSLVESKRRREVTRRLVRFEEDLTGVSHKVFERDDKISEQGIGKEASRALSDIDDLLFEIMDKARSAVGADTIVYLVPATDDLMRVREAVSTSDSFDFEARMNMEIYRAAMSNKQSMLLARGQGAYGIEPGYYKKRSSTTASLAVVPVLDGGDASGLLVTDSVRDDGIGKKDVQFLELVAVMLRDVQNLMIQFKRLSFSLTEFEELYGVSRDLAQAKTMQDVYGIIYAFCNRIIPLKTMIFTAAGKQESQIVSVLGQDIPPIDKKRFAHEGSLVGWVVENGKSLVFPEKDRRRAVFGDRIDIPGGGAFVLFPLLWEEHVMGTCSLNVSSENPPSPFHIRLLEVVLNMAVVTLMGIKSMIRLNRMAVTDSLTGLYNRRSFNKGLKRTWEQSDRYSDAMSVLMIDIDRFKGINDTYGHTAGDEVIKAVAATILSATRKVDLAARIGGEEFAVILPKSTMKSSVATAERIRKAIKKKEITHGRKSIKVTVSIGVSTFPEDGKAPEALVKEADRRLYAAKEGGRDRVVSD